MHTVRPQQLQLRASEHGPLVSAGLGWLGWAGLVWSELVWAGLGWAGLGAL